MDAREFAIAHDRYLEPPEEQEAVCCDECGEEMDEYSSCPNLFCPDKHDGMAKEMAIKIMELEYTLGRKKFRLDKLEYELVKVKKYAKSLEPQSQKISPMI
jgi:hypothetical protein